MNLRASGELSGILDVLGQMAVFETKVAELYSVCASTWKEDCQFWLDIWRDEISHALFINNIIEIVSKKPEVFEKGRQITISEIQAMISEITDTIESIHKGGLAKDKLLSIASRLENEFLEDKYNEVITTDDMEYKTLMQKIVDDTKIHKNKILQRIKEQ